MILKSLLLPGTQHILMNQQPKFKAVVKQRNDLANRNPDIAKLSQPDEEMQEKEERLTKFKK